MPSPTELMKFMDTINDRNKSEKAFARQRAITQEGRMWSALMTQMGREYQVNKEETARMNNMMDRVTTRAIEWYGQEIPSDADDAWFDNRVIQMKESANKFRTIANEGSDEVAKLHWADGGAFDQITKQTEMRLDEVQRQRNVFQNWLYGEEDIDDDGLFDTLETLEKENAISMKEGKYFYTKPAHGMEVFQNITRMVHDGISKGFEMNMGFINDETKRLKNKKSFERAMHLLDTDPNSPEGEITFPDDYVDLTKFGVDKEMFPRISEFDGEKSIGTATELYEEAMRYYDSGNYEDAQKWLGYANQAKKQQLDFIASSTRRERSMGLKDDKRLAEEKLEQQSIKIKHIIDTIDAKTRTSTYLSQEEHISKTPLASVLASTREWTHLVDDLKDRVLEVLGHEDIDVNERTLKGEFIAKEGAKKGVSLGTEFANSIDEYRRLKSLGLSKEAKDLGNDIISQLRYNEQTVSGRSMVREINFPGVAQWFMGNDAKEEEYMQYIFRLLEGIDEIEQMDTLNALDLDAFNAIIQANFGTE